MRAVIQRVTRAHVEVDSKTVGEIESGLLVLLGVANDDNQTDALYLANKVASLRIFEDEVGKMNLSVKEVAGSVLVVSQFTLMGDVKKGNRPSFIDAAPPALANELYQQFCRLLGQQGIPIATGVFQADMQVYLVNDGPVTILLDSRKLF